ncbi:MAG: SDR family NAD(P)-dependent oxidoreductase, partial [Erysipelotrichaceae bacterium]|nr:SDR family NAD(P)-dependent oxidoreductase [Erysipelotrichaceae bacterium]
MNDFRLDGKLALVTGATDGIGFGIACGLAAAGAKIVFNGRSAEKIEAAVARYKENGVDATGYVCDVTDEKKVLEMIAEINKEFGVIDILVNNAAIIKRVPMTEMDTADFRKIIDTDLNAPFIV